MKQIVFKGSEEQIQSLLELIEYGKEKLPSVSFPEEVKGCYTNNLWHVDDVKQTYNCTDEEALEILDNALTDERITSEIFEEIDSIAENMGIEKSDNEVRELLTIMNKVELILWEDVRRDCKYPADDNNNGFIFELNLLD